ncbi:DUF397 domain-containing protein [Streptomyces hirsutus]|uniref:DUF397 domain-containing protein n=1 Tax=Streptomyces hirsutus TaxID=35620 RepID=A0ABZ1H2Q5_9ACTN|nr:DUF397 domain-containing protein [Streptomyces hirsutus]WSD11393.1 DUF397 domain-containing protein [Streptomyces hirsutus]
MATPPATVLIRDSKDASGPLLGLSPTTWAAFLTHITKCPRGPEVREGRHVSCPAIGCQIDLVATPTSASPPASMPTYDSDSSGTPSTPWATPSAARTTTLTTRPLRSSSADVAVSVAVKHPEAPPGTNSDGASVSLRYPLFFGNSWRIQKSPGTPRGNSCVYSDTSSRMFPTSLLEPMISDARTSLP